MNVTLEQAYVCFAYRPGAKVLTPRDVAAAQHEPDRVQADKRRAIV